MVRLGVQGVPADQQRLAAPDVQYDPFDLFRPVVLFVVLLIMPEPDHVAGPEGHRGRRLRRRCRRVRQLRHVRRHLFPRRVLRLLRQGVLRAVPPAEQVDGLHDVHREVQVLVDPPPVVVRHGGNADDPAFVVEKPAAAASA